MHIETYLAQLGNRRDTPTGSVSMPVYHTTTFAHPEVGHSTGYDYSRSKNPTRFALEEEFARLEEATFGYAFSSGMSAVAAVMSLFGHDDHIIASQDLYGGTYRLFETVCKKVGMHVSYVDTGDIAQVQAMITSTTRALFIETPSNPTMRISDLYALSALAKKHQLVMIVDNTFMTPFLQKPLRCGADIVIHSATKYLGGHNDVLAGLVALENTDLAEKIAFYQNAVGSVLGPQDAWLLMRGMKTLALRMERHEQNALAIVSWLQAQADVTRIYYPGREEHPLHDIHKKQATGFGGMISFEVKDPSMVRPLLNRVTVMTYAESLGSVETLITHPASQTHADIPRTIRERYGVTDGLLRLSVGIEHRDDLLRDLQQAFTFARGQK